jgi:hypothetical protein
MTEPRVYWDEVRQKWMVDDYGRPREATPEEIDEQQEQWSQQQRNR